MTRPVPMTPVPMLPAPAPRAALAGGGPAAGGPPRAVAAFPVGRQRLPRRGRDGDQPQRGRPGDAPRRAPAAERRFYREDAAAAAVSEALDRLLAAGPDARWDHLTRALGLSAADTSLARARAGRGGGHRDAPGLRIPGRRDRPRRPVARAGRGRSGTGRPACASTPGPRCCAGGSPGRGTAARTASRRTAAGSPTRCCSRSSPGTAWPRRSGPVGREVEPVGEPVLYPAALDEIVGFASPASGAGQPGHRDGARGPARFGQDRACRASAAEKLGSAWWRWTRPGWPRHPDPAAVAVREARRARLDGSVLTWQHARPVARRGPRRRCGRR